MKFLEKILNLLDIMILDEEDLQHCVIEEMSEEEKKKTTKKIQYIIAAVLFGISGGLCMRLALISDGNLAMMYMIGAVGMFGALIFAVRRGKNSQDEENNDM